jgi:hypothetical protein
MWGSRNVIETLNERITLIWGCLGQRLAVHATPMSDTWPLETLATTTFESVDDTQYDGDDQGWQPHNADDTSGTRRPMRRIKCMTNGFAGRLRSLYVGY